MLHKRLLYLRKCLKLTQAQLASQTGITQNYLSQIETGRKTPSL
ncbi:helix-turn-helix transcriptional regulator, partial [Thermovirga sp.]|nr:helix-turn-helix transcriptional regulator [Thermovirga sp.]